MSDFRCAIEKAKRPGWKRCQQECPSCHQQNLSSDDSRPITTSETATGLYFDYHEPRPEHVSLRDVASHLSVTCRFAGATVDPATGDPVFYSVAQHALFVRDLVCEWGHPELCLPALHHDSHEYMLLDWPTPMKRKVRAAGVTVLDEMVVATNRAIGERFGIDPDLFEHPALKEADTIALFREAATFKVSRGVGEFWGRTEAAEPLVSPDRLWLVADQRPATVMREFMAAHEGDGGLL